MQKEMATIEQVAQDNHERARRLMRELSQMQQEYAELKKQVRPQPWAQGVSQPRSYPRVMTVRHYNSTSGKSRKEANVTGKESTQLSV